MKTILMTAVAAATLIATPAFAQVETAPLIPSSTINLKGKVENKCGVGHHISGHNGVAAGYTTGDVDLTDFTDGNGQFNTAKTFTNRSFGNLWCNYAAPVKLEVSSLSTNTPAGDTGSYANSFDVRITTNAGVYFGRPSTSPALTLASNGANNGEATHTTNGAFETGSGQYGSIQLLEVLPKARSSGGNFRPVAGTYTGYVRFTVGSN